MIHDLYWSSTKVWCRWLFDLHDDCILMGCVKGSESIKGNAERYRELIVRITRMAWTPGYCVALYSL